MENTSAASQELGKMHALSIASAIAITRLLPQLSAAEVIRLVEHARLALALQSTDLIAAMMFAQPLIAKWDDWTLAYLIGVSLGIKLTMDGFYLSDITSPTSPHSSLCSSSEERSAQQSAWSVGPT